MSIQRRTFLQVSATAGGGLLLGLQLACGDNAKMPPVVDPTLPPLQPDAGPVEPAPFTTMTAWVAINADDTVRVMVPRQEMGQGVLTAMPMILAEELEADWSKVRAEHAPADEASYGPMLTGGSSSVRGNYDTLRKAGAAAKEMLIAAAAARWGVEPSECRAENSVVYHDATSQSARYGELVTEAAALPVPENPTLKDPANFRLIGQSKKRLDTQAKAEGTAIFGLDVQREGMLTALVARAPVFGGTVAKFDVSAAMAVPGVRQVVQIPSGLAVLADHYWAAYKGREALQITWNEGEFASMSSEELWTRMEGMVSEGVEALSQGDAPGALDSALPEQRLEAVFRLPYLAHACMEPMNATAHVHDGECEIWAPNQAPTFAQGVIGQALGLEPAKVKVNTTMLGGGFGRRAAMDFLLDAAHASKETGAPVKVVYSREDDTRAGHYRPMVYSAMRGSLDAEGWPNAWQQRIVAPSIRYLFFQPQNGLDVTAIEGAANLPYAIANKHVTYKDPEILPVPTFFWRSVGSSQNAFITECFFDELAALGGKDPVDARLRLLSEHPRHARAVQRAAEMAAWGTTMPEGMARGIAVHESFGTVVAEVAEISIEETGVRVHRVVCVVDCGQVINPNTVVAQMESSIVYGLSAALYGEVNLANGRAVESNFHDYRALRMSEMPAIDTHIISEGDAIGGIGEPGLPPIAPAVANAVFSLTGTRVRTLPLKNISFG